MSDIHAFFDTPTKQDATIADVTTAFRDNIIKRPEARKWFIQHTNIDINEDDMEDEPPITSVTPTGQFREPAPSGRFGPNVNGDDKMQDGDKVTAKPAEEGVHKKGRKKK